MHTDRVGVAHGDGAGIGAAAVGGVNTVRVFPADSQCSVIPGRGRSLSVHTVRILAVGGNGAARMINHCHGFFAFRNRSVGAHADTAVIKRDGAVVVQRAACSQIHTVAENVIQRDNTVVLSLALVQIHAVSHVFRRRILPAGNCDVAFVVHPAVNPG